MWIYERKLEFPVSIKKTDPKLAMYIMDQFTGTDGELTAAIKYLNQRFSMVTSEAISTLNDIGTEELAHIELIGSIVHQLTCGADSFDSLRNRFYRNFRGINVNFLSSGDPITDLYEDMAAEQRSRTAYENLLEIIDDPDVEAPISFLREREIVHFQRFGECLDIVRKHLEKSGMGRI
ncbi:MAG: manganese catalase family protein [Clostridiales bacterium]|nr:manganese catalase family protein [Clostridiales bacterium]